MNNKLVRHVNLVKIATGYFYVFMDS